MPLDNQLKRTIADLSAIEKESFGKRQRFGFYVYLGAVLDCYARLRRNNEAKISADRVAELFGIRKRKGTHSIRVLIDATSSADLKTRSRWSRALRYAWHHRRRWKSLKAFFQENGGPAGMAEQFAALHRALPDALTIGGGDCVSPTALSVDVERIMPGQMFVKDGRVFRQPEVTEGVDASSAVFKRRGSS